MRVGVAIVALLFMMLTARAEVGGLPLPHERYREFLPGGGFSGPGLLGPSDPKGTSTPATQGPAPIGPGPQGPGGGGSGPLDIDSSGDPSGLNGETLTGAMPKHDYYKSWQLEEEVGGKLYTGDSPPNTVYDYPRLEALVETHVPTKIRTLLCYIDECSDEHLQLENSTLYIHTRVYLRDIRNTSAVRVRDIDPTSAVIFFGSNENQNESDIDLPYLTNRELVWNMKFDAPKNIRIKIAAVNLDDADSDTDCPKDFLVLYDPDMPGPTVFCTNDTNPSIQPYDNVTNFILRFSSDETMTFPRGFEGRIIILNNINAQSSQLKRSVLSTEKKKKEEEEEEMEVEVREGEGMLRIATERSESELQAHMKMFELCVDEMLEFGEETAAKYADHPLCGPASESYFQYLQDSCIRHD